MAEVRLPQKLHSSPAQQFEETEAAQEHKTLRDRGPLLGVGAIASSAVGFCPRDSFPLLFPLSDHSENKVL